MRGITSWTPGKTVAGPALTLQFMPKREDIYRVDEYADPEKQLHRHVLYHTQPGDIVVVDARGDLGSGVFGEMMLTYFKGRGGMAWSLTAASATTRRRRSSVLACGCAEYPQLPHADRHLPLRRQRADRVRRYAGDAGRYHRRRRRRRGGGAGRARAGVAGKASEHAEWEDFSRMRLAEGGDLRKYYPLSDEARAEYEAWRRTQGS